jgi:hypothetical protein
MVKVLIHTNTAIKGEAVKAGTTVEVDDETAARLCFKGDVIERDGEEVPIPVDSPNYVAKAPKRGKHAADPEAVEHADPEVSTRDPFPKRPKN